jgi:protein-tyrosine phosphatase
MDSANIRDMQRFYRGDPQHKIHLLMEFAGSSRDVADPWYTGDFEATWQDAVVGCKGILNWLGKSTHHAGELQYK